MGIRGSAHELVTEAMNTPQPADRLVRRIEETGDALLQAIARRKEAQAAEHTALLRHQEARRDARAPHASVR